MTSSTPTSRATLPLYLVSSGTSLFGNASIGIVLPWLVLLRTGDPAVAGLVAAASAVPSAIAAFVGGHLADRFGRRAISVLADVGSAVSVAALAIVDLTVGLNVGWFVALGILGALFDVPGMTAREAMVGDVARVSGVSLDRVASLRGALFGVSFLAGPALAGVLLAVLPPIDVVWVTAACSAIAALAMLVMPLPGARPSPAADGSPFAGYSIVRRNPVLLTLLVLSLSNAVLVPPLLSVLLPAHFQAAARPEFLGLSISAYAVGMIVGSGVYGVLFGRRRRAAWVVSNVLMAVGFFFIAPMTGFWLIAIGMALAGIGAGVEQPVIMVMLTRSVPDEVRTRVFGVYSALAMVVTPVGLAAVAVVIAGFGFGAVAWILAVVWALVAVWAVWVPSVRDYLRDLRDEDSSEGAPEVETPGAETPEEETPERGKLAE